MGRFSSETRPWNGNILDNNHAGDALVTILLERLALPCIILTSATYLYSIFQILPTENLIFDILSVGAVIPIGLFSGYFLATALSMALAAIGVLLTVLFFMLSRAIGVWSD